MHDKTQSQNNLNSQNRLIWELSEYSLIIKHMIHLVYSELK